MEDVLGPGRARAVAVVGDGRREPDDAALGAENRPLDRRSISAIRARTSCSAWLKIQ